MRQPIWRIYGQLGDYLTDRGVEGECRVILTFAQVEALIGRPLPTMARDKRRLQIWWHGDLHYPHAWYGWHRVGWRVESVAGATETISFVRLGIPADDQATDAVNTPALPGARTCIARITRTRKSGGRRGEQSGE